MKWVLTSHRLGRNREDLPQLINVENGIAIFLKQQEVASNQSLSTEFQLCIGGEASSTSFARFTERDAADKAIRAIADTLEAVSLADILGG